MLTLPSEEYLQIVFRSDLNVLVGRWMRQTTPSEMQQGYHDLLDVAVSQNCRRWLVDVRRRDHANQDGTSWMQQTFFPQLAPRLGSKVSLAYLFAPSHLNDLEADATVPPLTYFDGRPYRVQRFVEEHIAMSWLDNCRLEEQHELSQSAIM
ncbi:hypothetical protein [Hymenobacter jejuensis]|uniref:STAS/SEC14 domain-containing protein n=1 Tax=Hymenobacter jejuensis TaxID=2502781 RepID=A0A5B7ZZT1_9BACT|nr:hypothetical protein [Hymenobacter jejuensis]QDA59905.1 hypothetical protein FHG12_07190 [Hymenobacter jejuensis]